MNILHICSINNNKTSGISNVVPEHFINQKKYANVALMNCNTIQIEKLKEEKNVFYAKDIDYNIQNLPEPFNNPDLAIFHGIYIYKYTKIAKKLKKRNIPYIIIPHGSLTSNAQKIKRIKKILANLIFFNKFIFNSKCIQFLSIEEKNMSKRYDFNSFILGNGMNNPQIEKKVFENDKLKLIYIGRYDIFHKGIDLIIEYCFSDKEYMKKNNITVDLYGCGNDGAQAVKKLVNKFKIQDIITVHRTSIL